MQTLESPRSPKPQTPIPPWNPKSLWPKDLRLTAIEGFLWTGLGTDLIFAGAEDRGLDSLNGVSISWLAFGALANYEHTGSP